MANNPLYQANTGTNGATAPTNPVNDPNKPLKRRYNRFPMSHSVLNTLRYGDITPFLAIEGVEGDKIPFSSKHEIRSYTLKAPLMADIKMNKDYFMIPYQSILPNNWAKIYTNPTQGDDVPDDTNTIVDLRTFIYDLIFDLRDIVNADAPKLDNLMRLALLSEMFYSNGSLLACFNVHLAPLCKFSTTEGGTKLSFDNWLNLFVKKYLYKFSLQIGNVSVGVVDPTSEAGTISLHRALELMRANPDFTIVNPESNPDLEDVKMYLYYEGFSGTNSRPLNYARCCAYQIVASHFYTNDKIDYIFSADLYRQNMLGIANQAGIQPTLFEYNGVPTLYDALSGNVMTQVITKLLAVNHVSYKHTDANIALFAYMYNVFGFRQSLRFGDYFTGARPTPLAVGDVNAPVVDSSVSAIDMTKNIMMQRFLNAVNRAGRKFGDYVKEIMDGAPAPDLSDPKFLAHTQSYVSGFEVENTSENQGNIVTNLKSQNSEYAFEVSVEMPCIILGLVSFDISRVYSQTFDKHAMKVGRFDMFNPYMQYIGDQEVKASELSSRYLIYPTDYNFAYTLRHMEYKQKTSYASGGFVENLPAWAFIVDNNTSGVYESIGNISPDFIRSSSAELDRFYASLTGDSLGSYFHFIVKFDNQLNPARAMEFAPTIL